MKIIALLLSLFSSPVTEKDKSQEPIFKATLIEQQIEKMEESENIKKLSWLQRITAWARSPFSFIKRWFSKKKNKN